MSKKLHVVLGASGVVGRAVIKELKNHDVDILAVGRSKKVEGVDNKSADLLKQEQVLEATVGASYIYLCAGLTYDINIWRREWPIVMKNVIEASKAAEAVLIFVDNIYMYGPSPLQVPFTEKHEQNPPSQKGLVRKEISKMLLEAHDKGEIKGVIGRSADFYGPGCESSVFYISFLERMLQGKAPMSLGSLNQPHTFAYTEDVGRGLVSLAMDPSTYGQAWHLPVSRPVTITEGATVMNRFMATSLKVSQAPRLMMNLMGLFVTALRELKEMYYQFDHPYVMDDSKFLNHFPDFKKTEFDDGIKAMIASFKK